MKISSVTRLDFKTEAKKARDHLPANCWQRQAEDPAEQEPEDLSPHTSDSKLEIRLQVQGRGKPWVPQAALLTPSSSPLSLYSGLRPRVLSLCPRRPSSPFSCTDFLWVLSSPPNRPTSGLGNEWQITLPTGLLSR